MGGLIHKRRFINYHVKQEVENQKIEISQHNRAQDRFCSIIPGADSTCPKGAKADFVEFAKETWKPLALGWSPSLGVKEQKVIQIRTKSVFQAILHIFQDLSIECVSLSQAQSKILQGGVQTLQTPAKSHHLPARHCRTWLPGWRTRQTPWN